MSEPATSTPEAEAPAPTRNNNNNTTRNNNRRRPNNRNSNLASMANAERNFKGKIEDLPVIGKLYEQTDPYEKLIDAAVDYSIINLDEGDDLTKLLEKGEGDFEKSSGEEEPTITDEEEKVKSKVYVFQKKMDLYLKREHQFNQNKKRIFTILLGQCTPSLLTSVKSSENWTTKNEEKDPIWLMNRLKKLTVGIDDFQNELVSAHDALARIYRMWQRPLETNDQYIERFKEYWATSEAAAGVNCLVPNITKTSGKYSSMTKEEWTEATKAMYFFLHADKIRFGDKIREIQENVVLGTDSFPTTMEAAYRILSDTQSRLNQDRVRRGGGNDRRLTGYSNYQGRNNENRPTIPEGANIVIGRDRRVYTIQCNRCNEWGHYADQCPEVTDDEVSKKKFIFKCENSGECHHNYSSVLRYLLDTGSTHNTVKDKDDILNLTSLFKNEVLRMQSSTGDYMDYNLKGTLKNFNVDAFYNKNTAANILAFHTLSALDDAYMFYDSREADCFRLIYKDGREIQFQNFGDGLYTYVDPKDNWKIEPKEPKSFAQYLQTVNDKEQLMTKKEIERAKNAVEVQEYLGWPSIEEFLQIVRGNEGSNIDVTVDDIKRAVYLYGIPTPYLRGRATRRRPLKHDPLDNLKDPLPIELHEKRLELYIDIFKFAGVYFLLMESSRVKYVSIEDIESQKMAELIPLVQEEIDMYTARGLQITGVHVDNQLFNEQFAQAIKSATLIPYAANEHVSVAERRNRTIQQRMRSLLAGLPYKSIPKIMVRGLAKKVKVINQFPVRTGGVSSTISPQEIVEGRRKLDFSKRRINFGQYAEIHDGTTNTAKERTVEGIAMYPTNDREGFAFMCLKTGKYRHSNNWTQLPITDEVIQRVETIAKDIVNVKILMEEIDDYVNDEIMKNALRQEKLQNNTNNENDENEESSESENDSSDEENEQEIRDEQQREINDIPVVEDVESSDEEDEMNVIGPQVGDLQLVDVINETSSEGDIDMIGESESEVDVSRKMSEDEIIDALDYDVDGPTDIVDRQKFEEACQQARVIDRDEKEEEAQAPEPQVRRRQQPRRNVRTREDYRRDVVEGRSKKARNNYQKEINIGTQYFQKIGGK